jgi:hypothetical protein
MTAIPAWFTADVARKALWLPNNVKQAGIAGAYQQVWAWLAADIKAILTQMNIPTWLIALVPTAASSQAEIFKQFRFMPQLSGAPPVGEIAQRAEQLLIFGGSAQLPTPGDKVTGASLGAEGCTAAMSKYILAQLKLEFPSQLAAMNNELANSQSSVEMQALFQQAASAGIVEMRSVPFAQTQSSDFLPASMTIAKKPGGTHVFGWTRVPTGWNWSAGDKMAIGNTGLPQFGDRMILAQEYVTDDPSAAGELQHNQHGPINSTDVVYANGQPDLSNPGTNVYAVENADFVLINLVGTTV